jgi:hypothetical protein
MILEPPNSGFKPGKTVSILSSTGRWVDRTSGLFFLLALLVRLGFIRVKKHPMCLA